MEMSSKYKSNPKRGCISYSTSNLKFEALKRKNEIFLGCKFSFFFFIFEKKDSDTCVGRRGCKKGRRKKKMMMQTMILRRSLKILKMIIPMITNSTKMLLTGIPIIHFWVSTFTCMFCDCSRSMGCQKVVIR